MACLLTRCLVFRKSASFPSVSSGCTGALCCLTQGRFLTRPLTQRLAQKLHFSVKHKEQHGRTKHPTVPGENLAGGEKPDRLQAEVKCLSWSQRTGGIRKKSSSNVV